jgi:DNA modification methylase
MIDLRQGDCLDIMPGLEPESVDAIVTDPPYGLSFMGKNWDHGIPGIPFWQEALRVAKPGAHLLAFGGTRTFHRLTCAIEDAGWEIRDTLMWVYGSGFPKSLDIGKAVDKLQGNEREIVGKTSVCGTFKQEYQVKQGYRPESNFSGYAGERNGAFRTKGTSEWEGFGTALKPSWEPIILARKPLIGTVAENVLKHGTGGINIDGCRVGIEGATKRSEQSPYPKKENGKEDRSGSWARTGHEIEHIDKGRFPANLIHDNSPEVVGCFPETGVSKGGGGKKSCVWQKSTEQNKNKDYGEYTGFLDTGSATRFFKSCPYTTEDIAEYKRIAYFAKASKRDRNGGRVKNNHPTVKPTALMRYICKLITPPGGAILDPFMGSGSTGKAAHREDFSFIGIEKEPEYFEIAKARIAAAKRNLQYELFDMEAS